MYVPEHFKGHDLRTLDRLAAHDSFGTLISQLDGAPFASHLPVLLHRNGSDVSLTGHWARANPPWRDIQCQRVLFIFHGPHAYVSPRWYTAPRRHVPTWNYAAAHVYGSVRPIHDPGALEAIVSALAAKYESGAAAPWRLADADRASVPGLTGIVGFELRADEIQIKLKLNQNHPAANVLGAIDGLLRTDSKQGADVADLMRDALQSRK